jgi:hypothetical protein
MLTTSGRHRSPSLCQLSSLTEDEKSQRRRETSWCCPPVSLKLASWLRSVPVRVSRELARSAQRSLNLICTALRPLRGLTEVSPWFVPHWMQRFGIGQFMLYRTKSLHLSNDPPLRGRPGQQKVLPSPGLRNVDLAGGFSPLLRSDVILDPSHHVPSRKVGVGCSVTRRSPASTTGTAPRASAPAPAWGSWSTPSRGVPGRPRPEPTQVW